MEKKYSWRTLFFPLCTLMAILTFVFFAPLVSVKTNNGDIQCSILELLKLKGNYGTVESIIYFVVGWFAAWILDKFVMQKILFLFSKQARLERKKLKMDYQELKQRERSVDA